MNDTGPIDKAALDRLEEWGGERLLYEMVRLFLENSPDRMQQIRDGMEAGDLEQVKRAAHSLKSSAHNVGAKDVGRLSRALEEAASAGQHEESAGLHAQLVEAYELGCEGLREVEKGASE